MTGEFDQINTESLRNAKPPATQTQLWSFFCLCNIYRRFIRDFSDFAYRLKVLLNKGSPDKLKLNEEQLESLAKFIDYIIPRTMLARSIPDLPYSVDCDATAYQIRCRLIQPHHNGERKRIGFWSLSLINAKPNHSATECECLAVVCALKTLRTYFDTRNLSFIPIMWGYTGC